MKRKKKKTLDKIGKDYYHFDFLSEKNIYCYLCCKRVKRIEVCKGIRFFKLDEKLQFRTYSQWKQYICDKYCKYTESDLSEFSRYLNQMIRDKKPSHEHGIIVITILFTLLLTTFYEQAGEFYSDILESMNELDIFVSILVCALATVVVIAFAIAIISPITRYIFDDNLEENFLKDYKEIIDDCQVKRNEKR